MSTTQSPPTKELCALTISALERGMSRFSLRVHVDYVHRILSFTNLRGAGRLFRADLSDETGLWLSSGFFHMRLIVFRFH